MVTRHFFFFFCKFNNEFLLFYKSVIQLNGSQLEQRMCPHGLLLRACRGQWKCCQSNISWEIPEPTTSKFKSDTEHVLTSQRTRVFLRDCFKQPLRSIEDEEKILELIQENPRMRVRDFSGDQYSSYNGVANLKFKRNISVPLDSCCHDCTRRLGTSH